eukprot:TRINITY_DN11781_c0_g1_i3.p1 TRINITY_DN11781_c0_g1~~TRINITY_DN11781_c0_g1_i3.p1  ORF type:complete len:107 (-),score=45.70 TRINITY_DN11781_c0_g1_i3:195-476(-)
MCIRDRNYVYYLYNITHKDETEQNGIESYVFELFEKDETAWIPLLRAMSVPDEEKEANVEEIINANMAGIEKILAEINKKVEKIIIKKKQEAF